MQLKKNKLERKASLSKKASTPVVPPAKAKQPYFDFPSVTFNLVEDFNHPTYKIRFDFKYPYGDMNDKAKQFDQSQCFIFIFLRVDTILILHAL